MRLRCVDMGCNDFWVLGNLWTTRKDLGVDFERLDGIEMNAGSAGRAQERIRELGIPGEVVCGNIFEAPEHFEPHSYDRVTCMEVIEHVPDPGALLDLMCEMCAPGGEIVISTPMGAYENGNVPQWATVESKGHLRAMVPSEVASLLAERGKITGFETEQKLIVASMEPRPRKGKVIFFAGPADCRPEQIIESGLGGSETALCKMSEHFARRGYVVKVFAGEGGGIRQDHLTVEGKHDEGEVLYEPFTAWDPGEKADLFISLRVPEAFDRTINASRRMLWLHDADYGDRINETRIERTTEVAVLSKFHRDLMIEKYPYIEEKAFLTRNGIESSYFEEVVA